MQKTLYGGNIDPGYVVTTNNANGCNCSEYGADVTKAPQEVWLWLGLAFALGLLVSK